jgi:alpha-beta hydrolase superfamily lysophospholipase
VIITCLGSCVSSRLLLPEDLSAPVSNFVKRIDVAIPIKSADNSPLDIQAEVSRPKKKIEPKTLILLVPGTGNVSRRGETSSDGINTYAASVELYSLWAQELSDKGYFVLSYDKRTCTKTHNALCQTQITKDVDELGIKALAHDLDQVYNYAYRKLSADNGQTRIVLMSTSQGAQVISEAQCAKKTDAIILLSPIAGSLPDLWIQGLKHGAEREKNSIRKNELRNQAESTRAFFDSLAKEKIAANTTIYGASMTFWRTWLKSSDETIANLAALNKPVLILLSKNDTFSAFNNIISNKNYARKKQNFYIVNIDNSDKNLLFNNNLSPQALKEVIKFLQTKGIKAP